MDLKPRRRTSRLALMGAVAAGAVIGASSVRAADAATSSGAAGATVSELIVTAEKRTESIYRVPVAVTALTGSDLSGQKITNMFDLNGQVSGLSILFLTGYAHMTLRGVFQEDALPGSDPTVAIYENGYYLAQADSLGSSFLDVNRVEVLKGPQGTLYGRNSLGGAINIITNRPTDRFEASEEVSVGNYGAVSTRSVISGPITSHFFARLAVATDNHSGYSLNLFNGKSYDDQNAQTARLTTVFEPTSNLTFTTYVDYHREDDGNYATHLGGIVNLAFPLQGVLSGGTSIPLAPNGLAINPRLLDDYTIPQNKRQSWGVEEDIDWRLSDSITIKSLTSYYNYRLFYASDFYGTTWQFPSDFPNIDFGAVSHSYSVSQELQIIGAMRNFNWIAGLYYLDDVVTRGGYSFGLAPDPTPFPLTSLGSLRRPAYAVFGQAKYNVTDRLGITAGLRYSWESNSIDTEWTSMGSELGFFGPCVVFPGQLCHQVASVSYQSLTPRFEIHYQWTDGLMTYASASKGFKGGGFGIAALAPPFLPATVWTYEVGAKAVSRDQKWSLTAAAYYSDYKNMQVVVVVNGVTEIINAAAARIYGLELEGLVNPFPGLTIRDAFAYVDGRYTSFSETNPNFPFQGPSGTVDLAGHQLQDSSKYTNDLRAVYRLPIDRYNIALAGEWNWRTKQFFTEFNDRFEEQRAYSLFNASLTYTSADDRWLLEAWGKNLANSLIISQQNIGGCGCINSQYLPPRTYGLTFSYKY